MPIVSNAAYIIEKFHPDIEDTIDIEKFVQHTNIHDFVKTITTHHFGNIKLSFYSTFKKHYNLEEYLNIIKDPNQRRMFSKFRISNHKLEIEFGRYSNVPRQERLCKCCDKLAVEDEFHFSFECKKYENLRNNSHNIVKKLFPNEHH